MSARKPFGCPDGFDDLKRGLNARTSTWMGLLWAGLEATQCIHLCKREHISCRAVSCDGDKMVTNGDDLTLSALRAHCPLQASRILRERPIPVQLKDLSRRK